jgi:hypothetical protein
MLAVSVSLPPVISRSPFASPGFWTVTIYIFRLTASEGPQKASTSEAKYLGKERGRRKQMYETKIPDVNVEIAYRCSL